MITYNDLNANDQILIYNKNGEYKVVYLTTINSNNFIAVQNYYSFQDYIIVGKFFSSPVSFKETKEWNKYKFDMGL